MLALQVLVIVFLALLQRPLYVVQSQSSYNTALFQWFIHFFDRSLIEAVQGIALSVHFFVPFAQF